MKIQVECRDSDDPRAFFLGSRRLVVERVLERTAEDSQRRFRVRVTDGREFVLRQDRASGEWRFAEVALRPGRKWGRPS